MVCSWEGREAHPGNHAPSDNITPFYIWKAFNQNLLRLNQAQLRASLQFFLLHRLATTPNGERGGGVRFQVRAFLAWVVAWHGNTLGTLGSGHHWHREASSTKHVQNAWILEKRPWAVAKREEIRGSWAALRGSGRMLCCAVEGCEVRCGTVRCYTALRCNVAVLCSAVLCCAVICSANFTFRFGIIRFGTGAP